MTRREAAGRDGSGRPAFTLLELLVVVAIIGILAGLLFPVLGEARGRAWRISCLSNLRQLAGAHHLYLQDWDEQLPPWILPKPARPGWQDRERYWTAFLQPYLRSSDVLRDTSAPTYAPAPRGPAFLADYALLTWEKAGRQGVRTEPMQRWPGPPLSLGQVARPSETIQWMDGRTALDWTGGAIWRHSQGLNAAFVDGHARWMRYSEFWRVTPDESGMYWLHYGSADR